jgi:hypothetical protein
MATIARNIRKPYAGTEAARPPLAAVKPTAISGGRFCEVLLRARITKAELNLGLCARLPMPSGRQLATPGWRHVREHPPAFVDDALGLGAAFNVFKDFRQWPKRLGGLGPTFLSPPQTALGRDRYLPVIPRLDPTRFRLEILSRPQSSIPDPRAAGAFGKVAVPSGELAQFIRVGHGRFTPNAARRSRLDRLTEGFHRAGHTSGDRR